MAGPDGRNGGRPERGHPGGRDRADGEIVAQQAAGSPPRRRRHELTFEREEWIGTMATRIRRKNVAAVETT